MYIASGPLLFTDVNGDGGEFLLTEYSTPNNVEFFYQLPSFLFHSFKLAPPPFTASLPPSLFQDSSGTTSPSQTSLPVTLTPDSTPPTIVSFSFDLNDGSLVMTFDEPVDQDSINSTTGLYLTEHFQGSNSSVRISADEVSAANLNTELSVVVNVSTLNSVKFDTGVCTVSANCFLGAGFTSLSDTSGNRLLPSFSNIVAENFISDTTSPELVSYTINLDTSSVALTFSEPINPLSFDPFGITFDINQDEVIGSGGDLIQYEPVLLGGASSVSGVTNQDTVITLRLETASLVSLKLLVTTANITLTMEDLTVEDKSSNRVTPIPSATFSPPSEIVLDQSPPQLVEFIAGSPDSRNLTFVFSEPVKLSSWNTSAFVLTLLTTEGSYDYVFTEGSVVENDMGNSITFTIDTIELMFSSFERHYSDAYIRGSLGITTRGSLVDDLFGNSLEPLTQPLLFNATIPKDNPELLFVDFDLNTGKLYLTFTDIVVATFSAGKVRFQDDPVSPSHTLILTSNGSLISFQSIVCLTLHTDDLNGLKLNLFLGTSQMNTFVVLSEDFAYGVGSILLRAHNGTQVRTFTPDTTEPEVTSFELDLDSDIFSIQFNEPVVANTFDETRIAFINSTVTPLSQNSRVHLTSTYTLVQGNVTSLRALISVDDAIHIKRQPLCYTVQNCYVIFEENLVVDVADNVFLPPAELMQVTLVSPDVTPPQLLSFPLFDIDSGLFTLIFSEPVNGTSTDYTEVQFHNSPTDSNASVTLTEGFTSPDHMHIDFHMSRADLNQLKSKLDLCTNKENCWIRLPSFFVTDIGMNPFIHSGYESDATASFHQPEVFNPDNTAPVLEAATMDLNQGTLTLSFSEVIVEATFSPSDVTLHQSSSTSPSITLSPSSLFSLAFNGAAAVIQLTNDDLNWLKANDFFTSSNTTYLSLMPSLVDVSGNGLLAIVMFLVEDVIPDQTGPNLASFDYFDLENNYFVLSFDEPVEAGSLQATELILASQPRDDASTYILTGAASVLAVDDSLLAVRVTLTNTDRVQIKLMPLLATVRGNTYIFLGQNAIQDTVGNVNSLVPISRAVQLNPGGYRADVSPAVLVGFQLDLNSAMISITFDDVVTSSSIDPTALTLQNKGSSPTALLTLSSSSMPVNGNSDRISILVSEEDVLHLKLDLDLATSAANTYLSIDSSFATDIENRPVAVIPPSLALPLLSSSFVPDTTAASLSTFSLDMDTGTLQLNFSEPVLQSSFNPGQLTLHSQSSGAGTSLNIAPATSLLTTASASLTVEAQLLQSDLNFIKDALDLAIDTGTTFMSFTSQLVEDVSGNPVEGVLPNNSIVAIDFVIDTTPPELWGFDADLTPVAKVYLTFSETVRLQGQIQSSLLLMNSPADATVVIPLTDADESNQTGFNQVEISLSPPVITRLLVDTIASSVDSLYISLSVGVVTDTSGNVIIPVTAFQVQQLCKCKQEPCILNHNVMNELSVISLR